MKGRRSPLSCSVIASWAFLGACSFAHAEVRLASPFTDHMVLQRELPVPVWGSAASGERVSVSFGGQTQATTAAADGKWRVDLRALAASSDPRDLIVTGTNTLVLRDVLVGEVWLGSGQSNMAFTVSKRAASYAGLVDEDKEIAAANYPQVRMFMGKTAKAYAPQSEIGGRWEICTPETVPAWSAVGYLFARELHRELRVPVGIVTVAFGASCAQAWVRREAMMGDSAFEDVLARFDTAVRAYTPPTLEEEKQQQEAATKARAAGQRAPRGRSDPVQDQHNPTVLYNGMVAPIVPFAVRGVIWYQGESITAPRELFPRWNELLISDWRKLWGREFPFYFVQLAALDNSSNSPQVREWQAEALKMRNTAMAVTIDIGDRQDVHPHNKAPLGERLARIALARDYGHKLEYSGPLFQSAAVENGAIRVRFSHVEGGLVARGGPLQAFEIAGADGKFGPAVATIDGDTLLIRAEGIAAPVTARYAWANYPEGANLYNGTNLPAAPFRTDHPLVTPAR